MIAHWMLYVAAAGALLSCAALALEPALRALRLPQRWIWLAVMVLTLALPAAARWLPRAPQPAPAAASVGAGEAAAASEAGAGTAGRAIDLAALERPLRVGWAASAGWMAIAIAAAAMALHRRRRTWREAEVDGIPVLLSRRTGPAVVGLLRGRIVLPAWAMEAEPAERGLLLAHEREHLRAGDPRLLAVALAAVAVAPWNPAAWYQLRRLRLAIEIDCDARVLARHGDVCAYGALLLRAGRRASLAPRPIAAAAFGEPVSFLERRIRIMSTRLHRPRVLVVVPALALCAAALAGMRALPAPAAPPRTDAIVAGDTAPPTIVNAAAVARALNAEYPPLLRDAGVAGEVTVRMTVAPDGVPAEVAVVRSTHPEFAPAALRVMRTARFRPARAEGAPVAFTLELPVRFTVEPARPARLSADPREMPAPAWDQPPMVMNAAELARAITAEYPPLLREAGIRAQVQVRLRVSETGEVTEVRATSASHPEAAAAAERALAGARFRPAVKNGVPIAVHIDLPILFDVARDEQP